MANISTEETKRLRQTIEAQREHNHNAYVAWAERRLGQAPVLWTLELLRADLRAHGRITPETWDRVDKDERTFFAEAINTRHVFVDEYEYDRERDEVLVRSGDGFQPDTTMEGIIQAGLMKAEQEATADPYLAPFIYREELFLARHERVKAMLRGEVAADTLVSFSAYASEIAALPDGIELLRQKGCAEDRQMAVMFIDRRLSDHRVQSAAVTLDSSGWEALGAVLARNGFDEEPFALISSHDFGRYLIEATTDGQSIAEVIAEYVAQYDAALQIADDTDQEYSYGRPEKSVDAHEFITAHADWMAVYKNYNELLARALNGEPPQAELIAHLNQCLEAYEAENSRDFPPETCRYVREQIASGQIGEHIAAEAKMLLMHANGSLLKELFRSYAITGVAQRIPDAAAGTMMAYYAGEAAGSGVRAVANGDILGGCGLLLTLATRSQSTVAEFARRQGISQEEAVRRLEKQRSTANALTKRGKCRICYPLSARNIPIGGCLMCANCVTVWERGRRARGDAGGTAALRQVQERAAERAAEIAAKPTLVEEIAEFFIPEPRQGGEETRNRKPRKAREPSNQ